MTTRLVQSMKIYIKDGLRHRQATGYGVLSRNIILALEEAGHQVCVQLSDGVQWESVEPHSRERISRLPVQKEDEVRDGVALQICTPVSVRPMPVPALVYTQNGLSDLPAGWVETLGAADGFIVPNALDQQVFSRYFATVYRARQGANPDMFRPVPAWRREGPAEFTFLFVGSFSYRKGIDLLIEAFLEEFQLHESVRLYLHCPGADWEGTRCLMRELSAGRGRPRLSVDVRKLAPDGMCRLYNRCDALVTLSRGEGWCMPACEALLCGKPVIVPASSGPLEYLDETVAEMVPVEAVEIRSVRDRFAKGFVATYGKEGLCCYQPDRRLAAGMMRRVYEDYAAACAKAIRGQARVRKELSWRQSASQIVAALRHWQHGKVPWPGSRAGIGLT